MNEILRQICDRIVKEASPSAVFLYGQKPTPSGESLREASFFLVVEKEAKETERRLYRSLDLDFAYNLLVYTAEDWRLLSEDPTSYASSIRRKGVLLYGKA